MGGEGGAGRKGWEGGEGCGLAASGADESEARAAAAEARLVWWPGEAARHPLEATAATAAGCAGDPTPNASPRIKPNPIPNLNPSPD